MEVQDDVWKGLVSSLVSDDPNQGGDVLSPEDAAWVDSCLANDAELSDSSWDALKDALLDIISSEATSSYNTPAVHTDGFTREAHDDVVPMNEEVGSTQIPEEYTNDHVAVSGQAETARLGESDENVMSQTEKAETEIFRGFLRKKLSNSLNQKEGEDNDVGSEQGITNETEFSPDNIFKVWDLETPAVEEDELIQQLEKAMAESSLAAPPSDLDYSVTEPNMESLDDLVASMADLSLHHQLIRS